jgi:phosphomannomutase
VLEEYFPKSFDTGEVKIACAEERKKAVIEEIRERLLAIREKFSCLDGIRVEDENGWWLLRASNTQPALIMRSEASSKERLFSMLRQIREQLMLSDIKNALDDLVAT